MSLVQQINMNMNLDSAGDNYLGLHCSCPSRSEMIHMLRMKLYKESCIDTQNEQEGGQLSLLGCNARVFCFVTWFSSPVKLNLLSIFKQNCRTLLPIFIDKVCPLIIEMTNMLKCHLT